MQKDEALKNKTKYQNFLLKAEHSHLLSQKLGVEGRYSAPDPEMYSKIAKIFKEEASHWDSALKCAPTDTHEKIALGNKHGAWSNHYHSMAVYRYLQDDFKEAIQCYEKAAACRRTAIDTVPWGETKEENLKGSWIDLQYELVEAKNLASTDLKPSIRMVERRIQRRFGLPVGIGF